MQRWKSFTTVAMVLAVVMCLTTGSAVLAGDYPDKPVSMVVAYSPGGATDFQARIVTMLAGKEDLLG